MLIVETAPAVPTGASVPRRRRPRGARSRSSEPLPAPAAAAPEAPAGTAGTRGTCKRAERPKASVDEHRRRRVRSRRRRPRLPPRRVARHVGAGGAVGPPAGARDRRRHQPGPGTGPGGRITQDDVKEFAKRVMNSLGGSGQAAAASGAARRGGVGPALPDFSKWGEVERKPMTRHPPQDRRAPEPRLEHDSARHPVRQGRHHGARAGAQEVPRRSGEGRRQPDGHRRRRQGGRQRAQGVPAVQRLGRRGRRGDRLQEVHQRRHRRRHRERPARAGRPQRRSEEPHPDVGRDSAAGREGQGAQAVARRDVGRVDVDHESRRHRRHRVHADRQLARGGDPRHLARRVRAGVERHGRSSRGRCCRCRSATTTA